MLVLDGMFSHAAQSIPSRDWSGLVEQQAWFSRMRL